MVNQSQENRIAVADGLRGFAIIAISLLHNINHYNLSLYPVTENAFLQKSDGLIYSIITAISSGKVYGLFALLFGFTFYLQLSNQEKKGEDFKYRFIWRMLILFVIGTINSAFFAGEILVLYSIVGLMLVPLRHASNKTLLIIAGILFLQPVLLGKIAYILLDTNYTQNFGRYVPDVLFDRLANDSFLNLLVTNLTIGKKLYWMSLISNGERIFQTAAFFNIGLIIGRARLFKITPENNLTWKKIFFIFLIFFTLSSMASWGAKAVLSTGPLRNMVVNLLDSWANLSIVFLMTVLFLKIYSFEWKAKLGWMETLGKMSLTNYLLQSILGSFAFYGYGLSLSKTCGVTMSFIIGGMTLVLQYYFCKLWLKHHKRGPMEQLWHHLTWIQHKKFHLV